MRRVKVSNWGSTMSTRENVKIASEIFDEYGASIQNMLRCHGLSEQDAEDIYQNIFVALVRHPPSHDKSLSAYLKTVVRNHVRDFYRRALSRRGFVERYASLQKAVVASKESGDGFDRMEQEHQVMELLEDALPPYMAQVLIERYRHGENIDRIASKLGVEKRSVSRYCCTGLQRLRHLLDRRHS